MKRIIIIGLLIGLIMLVGCVSNLGNEKYCEQDSDCIFHCPKGCINENYNTPSDAMCKMLPGDCECISNECTFVVEEQVDLSNCKTYYDGCNRCTVIDGEVTACTEMYCEEYKEPNCLTEFTKEEKDCIDNGGRWQYPDMPNPEGFCNMPTTDAGESCTDSSQCESYCQAVGDTGECYEYMETTSGCMNELTNGEASEWCY